MGEVCAVCMKPGDAQHCQRQAAASARTARVSEMFGDLWKGVYHNSGTRFVNERNLPDVWADAEMIVDYQIKKEGGG